MIELGFTSLIPPRVIRFGLRLVVATALLSGILVWIAPPADLLAAVAAAQPRWLLSAAALTPMGLVLQWWKWRRLVRVGLPHIGERDILRSLFAGFGLGLLTPGRLGELGRGSLWPGDRLQALTLAAADRLVSSVATLVAGAACALYTFPAAWGLWAVLAVLVAGLSLRRFSSCLSDRLAVWRQRSALANVSRSAWLGNIVAAILFNMLFFIQMFCLLRATGPLNVEVVVAIPILFALKTLLPISLMDLGVREAAAAAVLGSVGVAAATAVQASLMLFGLNVLAPGLAGLLVLSLGTRAAPLPTSTQESRVHPCALTASPR